MYTRPVISPLSFGNSPLNDTTPFTYRDAYTYQQKLYDLNRYLNETVVKGIGDVEDWVEWLFQFLNNKTGNLPIQYIDLTENLTLEIDNTWPNEHIHYIMFRQNVVGGWDVTAGENIIGSIDVEQAPESYTLGWLVPRPDGKWELETWDSAVSKVVNTGVQTRAAILALLDVYAVDKIQPLLDELEETLLQALADLEAKVNEVMRVKANMNFYVASNGSDSNDGLSPSAPRKTVNSIIRDTNNLFFAAGVEVIINVAAGSYSENVRFENLTGEIKNYRIRGVEIPHPARPQVTWTNGLGSTSSGFIVRSKSLNLIVEYIEFYGYNGNSSAGGIVLADATLTTNNAHFTNCFWGITASRADLNVPNGVFTDCGRVNSGGTSAGAGIRSLMLTNHSIGNQRGSLQDSTIFRGNNYGMLAQELSTGHVDYCTFDGNDYGLVTRVSSRANAATSLFINNGIGILSTGNSYVLTSNDAFGGGNHEKFQARAGGLVTLTTFDAYIKGVDTVAVTGLEKMVGHYDSISHSGASSYVFERFLSKNFWDAPLSTRYPARKLRVEMSGFISGTNVEKTMGVRLGTAADDSAASFTIPANYAGSFSVVCDFIFKENGTQIISGVCNVSGFNPLVSSRITTVSMTDEKQIRVYASTANADDVVNIRSIEIYVER